MRFDEIAISVDFFQTLLEQLKGLYLKTRGVPLDKIPPTIGLNSAFLLDQSMQLTCNIKVARIDIGSCQAVFWDLGGQTSLRSIWGRYYKDAEGLLFMIDSTDFDRLEEAKLVFGMALFIFLGILTSADQILQHPDLRDAPILLLANKQDIEVDIVTSLHFTFALIVY